MLKSMRKNMKIIMWVLLVTFVLWGGSSAVLSRSKTANYAGVVSGKKVGWKEYEQNYSAVLNQAKLAYGEKFNEIKQYLNLEQGAWDRIILLRDAAKKRIRVSDNEVVETVCNIPLFQDASGKFVPQIYKRVVEYFLRVPAREFEDQMKDTIKISKLRDRITNDVAIGDSELLEKYKARFEKVNADFALVNADDFKTQAEINDEKINQYYQLHKQNFKTPMAVNIEYIPFEYSSYKTKDEAEDAASDVSYELGQEKQPNIYVVAKKFNLPVKETGFFAMDEQIPGIGLSYQVAFEAFKLEQGQISNPIKTEKGRYIIKLKAKKEPYVPDLDEVKDKVKETVAFQETKKLAEKKAEELLGIIKQNVETGWTFRKACDKLGLEVNTTGLFTKSGYIPKLGEAENFANAAFSSKPGKLAGKASIAQGAAIIFVLKRMGIDEERFKKEKEEFKKSALQEKQSDYFEEYFRTLKQKANIKIISTPKEKSASTNQPSTPASIPFDDF